MMTFDYTRSLDRAQLRLKRQRAEAASKTSARVSRGDSFNDDRKPVNLHGITLGRVHSARPFDYLNRPGGMSYLPRTEQGGSNHSVRDIAL